jgi:hypothetical protein
MNGRRWGRTHVVLVRNSGGCLDHVEGVQHDSGLLSVLIELLRALRKGRRNSDTTGCVPAANTKELRDIFEIIRFGVLNGTLTRATEVEVGVAIAIETGDRLTGRLIGRRRRWFLLLGAVLGRATHGELYRTLVDGRNGRSQQSLES